MSFNMLLTLFSLIAIADGVIAILAPGPFLNIIWHQRTGPDAYLFVQGWGACLIASGLLAWGAKRLKDSSARQWFALCFFTYNLIAATLWLIDALSRGWTPLSIASFIGLMLFTLGFAYFGFLRPLRNVPAINSPA